MNSFSYAYSATHIITRVGIVAAFSVFYTLLVMNIHSDNILCIVAMETAWCCTEHNFTHYQERPQADAQDARASTKLMDLEVCYKQLPYLKQKCGLSSLCVE